MTLLRAFLLADFVEIGYSPAFSKVSAGLTVDAGCEHIRFEQVQGAWNKIAKIEDGAERINLGFLVTGAHRSCGAGRRSAGQIDASREVLRLVTEVHNGCLCESHIQEFASYRLK